jgi:hypothetical protein
MHSVRIFHSVSDAPPVDLYVDDTLIQSAVSMNFSKTLEVHEHFHLELRVGHEVLLNRKVKLDQPHSLLVLARSKDHPDKIVPFLIGDRVACPDAGHAKLRFVHASDQAMHPIVVNKAVLGEGPSTPFEELVTLEYRTVSTYIQVDVNKVHSFQLVNSSNQEIIYVSQNPVRFSAGFIYDFIITGDPKTDDIKQGLHIDVLSNKMCAKK